MNLIKSEIVKLVRSQTELTAKEIESLLERPGETDLGDYALPCFRLAKKLRTSPQKIAQDLARRIKPSGLILKVNPVGAYINFFTDPAKLIPLVIEEAFKQGERYGQSDRGKDKTIMIDYSSPNIAKPFGIGHLRSTVIGNALYKVHTASGYKCIGINHLGDWGTQFGKLMEAYKRWGTGQKADLTVSYLNELYTRFHEENNKDAGLETKAREWFKRLEDGNQETQELWENFRQISMVEFERVYQLLEIKFDLYQGEAFYHKLVPETIRKITEKGLSKLSEGALIVDLEKYGMPPCLLKKADEAGLYATRDIAGAIYRYETYKFHKLIYVVGSDQKLHFRQVFKVLELMGYPWARDCIHVDFGLIRFKGEKMSTRKGQTILLEDVLNKTIELSKKVMQNRTPELQTKGEKSVGIARAVGIGAVIFNDLRNKRIKDTDFDWDQMLSFEGETGPYLQYMHTRLANLLKKYQEVPSHKSQDLRPELATPWLKTLGFRLLNVPEELTLIKLMNDFPEIIQRAAEEYEPSLITNYLTDLAHAFNRYYRYHRIISDDADLTRARITLCLCLKHIIKQGLTLLGITPLETM